MSKNIGLIIVIIILSSVLIFLINRTNLNKSGPQGEVNKRDFSFPKLPITEDNFLKASFDPDFIPIRNWSIPDPATEAKSAIVFDSDKNKILYQENIREELPIASLTKLMNSIIVLENLDNLENTVIVSQRAVATEGKAGNLVVNEKITVRNLLYALLMESSNDAAVALAEYFVGGIEKFVELMNRKAEELGLESTHFSDPTGLDSRNFSTVLDLAHLTKYALTKPFIWEILSRLEMDIYSQDGRVIHHLTNTNKLLRKLSQIIGGKTGFTEEAEGCMVVVSKSPSQDWTNGENLITIVLGAKNREGEIEKLLDWVEEAYLW